MTAPQQPKNTDEDDLYVRTLPACVSTGPHDVGVLEKTQSGDSASSAVDIETGVSENEDTDARGVSEPPVPAHTSDEDPNQNDEDLDEDLPLNDHGCCSVDRARLSMSMAVKRKKRSTAIITYERRLIDTSLVETLS